MKVLLQGPPEPGADPRKWEVGRILRFRGYSAENAVAGSLRQGNFKAKEYLRVVQIPKGHYPMPLGGILVRSLRTGEKDMVFPEEVRVARTLPRRLRVCAPLKLRPPLKRYVRW